mgnify:CR=1 FL=1
MTSPRHTPRAELVVRRREDQGGLVRGREHRVEEGEADADIAVRFPVGTRLRILPNHACATGAQFPEYQALSEDGSLRAWGRFHGW